MSKYSPLSKPCKYDNCTPLSKILQSSASSIDNNISHNGNDKIKIMKIESMNSQQLKRHRSRSHSLAEYSSGDLFTGDQNNLSCSMHTYGTSRDSSQLSHNSSINNHWIKEKHKKETHNRVERKRRDFINGQIQRLADLLPTELFFNYDLKMNKGVILKNSVEYISSMKSVEEINRQLILENELASRLIRILIAYNDLNCSELSINEEESNRQCKEEININNMIKEWDSLHQENKKLFQKISNRKSNAFCENKKEMSCENISTIDTANNNPILISTARKRYSSVPTNINNDFSSLKGLPTINIIDKTSPILNSLLKKNEPFKHHTKESILPSFSIENIEDNVHFYLQCTDTPSLNEDMTVDDITESTVQQVPVSSTNENIYQIQNKLYYVLPKSSKSSLGNQVNQRLMPDQNNDPMLLSDNITFDTVDR